jgi:diketogulonate reductase-like aldo/keto reductase
MNQVEMHPYLQQNELLEFCKKHDIAGWSCEYPPSFVIADVA